MSLESKINGVGYALFVLSLGLVILYARSDPTVLQWGWMLSAGAILLGVQAAKLAAGLGANSATAALGAILLVAGAAIPLGVANLYTLAAAVFIVVGVVLLLRSVR